MSDLSEFHLDDLFVDDDGDELNAVSIGDLSEHTGISMFLIREAMYELEKPPPKIGNSYAIGRNHAEQILELLADDDESDPDLDDEDLDDAAEEAE